jgi:hypothetical protein
MIWGAFLWPIAVGLVRVLRDNKWGMTMAGACVRIAVAGSGL